MIKMDAKEFRKKFDEARKKTGWVQIVDREGRAVYVAKIYSLPTQPEYDDRNWITIGRVVNIYRPDLRHSRAWLGFIKLDSVGDVKPLYNLNLIKSKPDYDSHEEWLKWREQRKSRKK